MRVQLTGSKTKYDLDINPLLVTINQAGGLDTAHYRLLPTDVLALWLDGELGVNALEAIGIRVVAITEESRAG